MDVFAPTVKEGRLVWPEEKGCILSRSWARSVFTGVEQERWSIWGFFFLHVFYFQLPVSSSGDCGGLFWRKLTLFRQETDQIATAIYYWFFHQLFRAKSEQTWRTVLSYSQDSINLTFLLKLQSLGHPPCSRPPLLAAALQLGVFFFLPF